MPLPPLAEQHRIVAKVDELMALASKIRDQLRNSKLPPTPIPTYALKGLGARLNPPNFGELVLRFLGAKADETDIKLAGGSGRNRTVIMMLGVPK